MKSDYVLMCINLTRQFLEQGTLNPLPTIDEILQDQSKVFTKLNKIAYHQIELAPESQDIMTFVTQNGLYCYKRLMFGINCAPEMYQQVMQQVLQGCEGMHHIMDTIINHGVSKDEHEARLKYVLSKIRDCDLVLYFQYA